jgi:hypothetical protein
METVASRDLQKSERVFAGSLLDDLPGCVQNGDLTIFDYL